MLGSSKPPQAPPIWSYIEKGPEDPSRLGDVCVIWVEGDGIVGAGGKASLVPSAIEGPGTATADGQPVAAGAAADDETRGGGDTVVAVHTGTQGRVEELGHRRPEEDRTLAAGAFDGHATDAAMTVGDDAAIEVKSGPEGLTKGPDGAALLGLMTAAGLV